MSFKQKQAKARNLLNKANFLQKTTDENILVSSLEQELSTITSFKVEFKVHDKDTKVWYYSIHGYHSAGVSHSNRLKSLILQLRYFIT